MPILESIQAAEEKAEQKRSEATKKVEALLQETRKVSEEKAKKMVEEANQRVSQIDAETTNRIALKEKEINLDYEQKDQKVAHLAQVQTDKAIDFILKKVFEI